MTRTFVLAATIATVFARQRSRSQQFGRSIRALDIEPLYLSRD